jgi:hypothetical protein
MFIAPVVVSAQLATVMRDARHATMWSASAGGAAAACLIGYTTLRVGRPAPPLTVLTLLPAGMAVICGLLALLIFRLCLMFRSESPTVAARRLFFLILRLSLKTAVALIVLDAFARVVWIDFANEIPEIVYYYLEGQLLWLGVYAAFAFVIVLVWSYIGTRPNNTTHTPTWRLALFGIVPPATAAALLLPILTAWVEALRAAPMLDCTPANIPGYVPDMVDYSRLIFNSLAQGATLGLGHVLGFSLSKCVADVSNLTAVTLVWVLRIAPVCIFMWLGLRRYRLGI